MSRSLKTCVATFAVLLWAHDARAGWATLAVPGARARGQRRSCSAASRRSPRCSVLAPEVVRVRFSPTLPSAATTPMRSSRASWATRPSFDVGRRAVGRHDARARASRSARAVPRRLRDRRRRVAGRGRPGAGHRDRGQAASRSGSGCGTTSTSTASARRSASSTSAAGKLGGYSYAMWNSDTFGYDCATPTRSTRRSRSTSCCATAARTASSSTTLTARTSTSATSRRRSSPSARTAASSTTTSSTGPTPKQVIERYTALTGRMPLPPRWALGYHQCRYSYYPESQGPLHRRELPRAPHPGRRDLARHPLPWTATRPSPGTRSASPIRSGSSPTCAREGFRTVVDRRSASEEAAGHRPPTTPASPAITS